MSTTRPLADERAPLLGNRDRLAAGDPQDEREGQRIDPAQLDDAVSPEEKRKSLIRWTIFWMVFAVFTVTMIVLAVKKGGAEFDFKKALKKAAGGVSPLEEYHALAECVSQGVAGAAAMVVQVLVSAHIGNLYP